MFDYDSVLKKYYNTDNKRFKEKLKKSFADRNISFDDASKLLLCFGKFRRLDILKIILDSYHGMFYSSVRDFAQLDYPCGLFLVIDKSGIDTVTSEDIVDVLKSIGGAPKNIEMFEFFFRHYFISSDSLRHIMSSPGININVLKKIIDNYFRMHGQNNSYFIILTSALQRSRELGMYIIENVHRWASPYDCYIYGETLLYSGNNAHRKNIYRKLRMFFPDVDYGDAVCYFIFRGNCEILKMILADEPKYYVRALGTLLLHGSEIIIAFCRPHYIHIYSSTVNRRLKSLLENYNRNPVMMANKFREEYRIRGNNSMIFALTIFLCDDFLKLRLIH